MIFSTIGIISNKNFSYEPCICNGSHYLVKKAMNFDDVAAVPIKGNDYRIHFLVYE